MRTTWKRNFQDREVPNVLPSESLRLHKRLQLDFAVKLLWTLLLVGILGFGMHFLERELDASTTPGKGMVAINCTKEQPKILTLSSVDKKFYRVDVCSVADSAEGED